MILQISIDGNDRRILLGFNFFFIPVFFWVRKFGKYIFFCVVWFSEDSLGYQNDLKIRGSAQGECLRTLAALPA